MELTTEFKVVIPEEDQLMIARFLQEQPQKCSTTRITNSCLSGRSGRGRKSTRQIEHYARQNGFLVTGGNGRHGKHLVAPNGLRHPMVDHGGNKGLATGTERDIIKFIKQNSPKLEGGI